MRFRLSGMLSLFEQALSANKSTPLGILFMKLCHLALSFFYEKLQKVTLKGSCFFTLVYHYYIVSSFAELFLASFAAFTFTKTFPCVDFLWIGYQAFWYCLSKFCAQIYLSRTFWKTFFLVQVWNSSYCLLNNYIYYFSLCPSALGCLVYWTLLGNLLLIQVWNSSFDLLKDHPLFLSSPICWHVLLDIFVRGS